ncbi:DUF3953 domain-containing protein [Alkalihalobacillus oceani]|uniref:DUF3953 domain-containing protein n=1 Tax=Halalkalibacter oceani TaxID=1653776 RepID=UPI00203A438C|nr:DUF3953 domain-containing protein [Halalkalibacter oceani]MCM3763136.1 DUF3953 domain-containing protein [Halalkalibacter oceani]
MNKGSTLFTHKYGYECYDLVNDFSEVLGGRNVLNLLRNILSVIVIVLAGYSLFTKNFEFMPYLMLIVSFTVLLTGVTELKKDKKAFLGYFNIFASLFVFFVSITMLSS